MPRYPMFVALAAGLVAGTVATAAHASALPTDRGVITNILMPLKGSAAGASGTATIQVDPKAHKVCYVVEQTGLTGALTGAIVKGGTVVLPLKNARNGDVQGCTDVAQDVARQIVEDPTSYQLSVNNGALATTLSPISNFQ